MSENKTARKLSAHDGGKEALVSQLERELTFLVRWLEANQRRRSFPLERAHYLVLLLLMEDGPQGVGYIAERLYLDTSTVTRQVSVMVQLGLVKKQTDQEDRRCGKVCATEKGRREAEETRRQREQRVDMMLADWPLARREMLADILGDLNGALCRLLEWPEA